MTVQEILKLKIHRVIYTHNSISFFSYHYILNSFIQEDRYKYESHLKYSRNEISIMHKMQLNIKISLSKIRDERTYNV